MIEELQIDTDQIENSASFRHRLAIRFPPAPTTFCRVFSRVGGEAWHASIQDISLSGISLSVKPGIDPETQLVLELGNSGRGFFRLLQLRVLRVRYGRDGSIVASGTFTPQLSYDELQLLR